VLSAKDQFVGSVWRTYASSVKPSVCVTKARRCTASIDAHGCSRYTQYTHLPASQCDQMSFCACFLKDSTKLDKVKFSGIFATIGVQRRQSSSDRLRQLMHSAVLVLTVSAVTIRYWLLITLT